MDTEQSAVLEFLADPATHGGAHRRTDRYAYLGRVPGRRSGLQAQTSGDVRLRRLLDARSSSSVLPAGGAAQSAHGTAALPAGRRGDPGDGRVSGSRRCGTAGRVGGRDATLPSGGPLRPTRGAGSSCRSRRWRHWPMRSPRCTDRRRHGRITEGSPGCGGSCRATRPASPSLAARSSTRDPERAGEDSEQELGRQADCLEARRQTGFVRQCHGDLHLRNIVLLDGVPTLFDAVEFNDEIACTDVQYDLAFLLMDLWRRRLRAHANVVWNRYLAHTDGLGRHTAAAALPVMSSGCAREDQRHRQPRGAGRLPTGANSKQWLVNTSRLRASCFIRRRPRSSQSGDCRAAVNRRWPQTSHLGWGRFQGRWCSGVTNFESGCAACPPCSTSVQRHTYPTSRRGYTATLTDAATLIVRGGHSAIVDAVHGLRDDRQHLRRLAAELNGALLRLLAGGPAAHACRSHHPSARRCVGCRSERPSPADRPGTRRDRLVSHRRVHFIRSGARHDCGPAWQLLFDRPPS